MKLFSLVCNNLLKYVNILSFVVDFSLFYVAYHWLKINLESNFKTFQRRAIIFRSNKIIKIYYWSGTFKKGQ